MSIFRKMLWAGAALLALGIALQFVRPSLENRPVTADLSAPPAVKEILKTSCYNCHSNETKLSWFDWPVPAYWLVARDVRLARSKLNFSEIGSLPQAQQNGLLFESFSQIELDAMPIPQYKRLHPESVVTPAQLAVLKDYLKSLEPHEPASATEMAAADDQFSGWIQQNPLNRQAPLAPNGIAFVPDYKYWRIVSSTNRSDNRTLREIFINPVGAQAIVQNHINPWPDGTIFAKVSWLAQPDDKGVVRTGAFYQVEFMIRDQKKYASTLGWGWARWRGANLTPYGKDASFTNECVGCHAPMRHADYVFTAPIGGAR
jgi:hypothetical protein